jgi:hypothetical protein
MATRLCVASDWGLIRMPLDCHWKLPGRDPVAAGLGVGDGDDVAVGDGLGLGELVALPVQATPLSAKSVGAGLLRLFQEPLKPIVAEPPVPSVPFQLALAAVTVVPDCEYRAFQPWVTCWPTVKSQVRFQELTGVPRLVTTRLAVNPPGHWEGTV